MACRGTLQLSLVFLGVFVCLQVSVAQDSSPASEPEGRAAVGRLIEALGGASTVNAVRTLHQVMSIVQQGQQTLVDQSISYPDKQIQLMRLPDGRHIRVVVTPEAAFWVSGAKVRELVSVQRMGPDAALKHDFLNVLQHLNNPKYTFRATAKEKLGDVEATVVEVNADGVSTRWWIGPDGRLLKEVSSDTGSTGMKYLDWKNFGGLLYPTRYEIVDETGNPRFTMNLVTMEVNAAIDPNIFKKPQ